MIKTFRDAATETLFTTGKSRRLAIEIQTSGLRRLRSLDEARTLADLRGAGNSLEQRRGADVWALRINDKYRIVFTWRDGHAWDVEIEDHPKTRGKGR